MSRGSQADMSVTCHQLALSEFSYMHPNEGWAHVKWPDSVKIRNGEATINLLSPGFTLCVSEIALVGRLFLEPFIHSFIH